MSDAETQVLGTRVFGTQVFEIQVLLANFALHAALHEGLLPSSPASRGTQLSGQSLASLSLLAVRCRAVLRQALLLVGPGRRIFAGLRAYRPGE